MININSNGNAIGDEYLLSTYSVSISVLIYFTKLLNLQKNCEILAPNNKSQSVLRYYHMSKHV